MDYNEKISQIKKWLGTGSINIFGIQFSGKDTVGMRLADLLGAEFISSGEIIRSVNLSKKETTDRGLLTPTKEFSELMEDYLLNQAPADKPLILSSVGRWIGEEAGIIRALDNGGHTLKAVLALEISEDEVYRRWRTSLEIGDRGNRIDDMDKTKIDNRINEFKGKTLPVIEVYRQMGLLIEVNGERSRDEVFDKVIDKLYKVSSKS